MAFLFSFATPRTRALSFEPLGNVTSGLLGAALGLFKAKPTPLLAAASAAAGSSSAGAEPQQPSLLEQLQPEAIDHNLQLATLARKRVELSLLTSRSVDKDIEAKRIVAISDYLPFIATLVAQNRELDAAAQSKNERTAKLEWSGCLLTGCRPAAGGEPPFFAFHEGLNLDQELAHAYFILALGQYQIAGSLSFHALQLANSIPAYSFKQLLPAFASQEGTAAAAAAAPPARMFNPLSYVAPTPAGAAAPKSASEVASIRAEIIAKRKAASTALRTAAGMFDFLATDYLPPLPIPRMGRLPDTMPAVSAAFSLLSLVHAQQHTILSALINASSAAAPPSALLLSKLCHGIVLKLTAAYSQLQGGTGSFFRALEQSLHVFFRVANEYYFALRIVFLGIDAELAGKHGLAIAFLTRAQEDLSQLAASIDLKSIRDCNPVLSEMKQWIGLETSRVGEVLRVLTHDNDSIYFDSVPSWDTAAKSMPPEEEATFMAPSIAFSPPKPLHALFLPGLPNPSKWTSGAGGGGGGSAQGAPAAAAAAKQTSADGVRLSF